MIRINLLPVRVSKKKEAGRQQLILFALVIVFVIVGNSWWSKSRGDDLTAREQKLRRTKDEIAQLEKIIGEVKDIKSQQAELKDKLAVLDKLRAGRQGPVKMLDELATIVPKKLWLKKMEEKGGAVTFEGTALTIDDVSSFMSALRRSQFFSAVELRKTTAKAEKIKQVDFLVSATANYTPAPAAPPPGGTGAPAPAPAPSPSPAPSPAPTR
jgi:type IV pilus assembly protein PilN